MKKIRLPSRKRKSAKSPAQGEATVARAAVSVNSIETELPSDFARRRKTSRDDMAILTRSSSGSSTVSRARSSSGDFILSPKARRKAEQCVREQGGSPGFTPKSPTALRDLYQRSKEQEEDVSEERRQSSDSNQPSSADSPDHEEEERKGTDDVDSETAAVAPAVAKEEEREEGPSETERSRGRKARKKKKRKASSGKERHNKEGDGFSRHFDDHELPAVLNSANVTAHDDDDGRSRVRTVRSCDAKAEQAIKQPLSQAEAKEAMLSLAASTREPSSRRERSSSSSRSPRSIRRIGKKADKKQRQNSTQHSPARQADEPLPPNAAVKGRRKTDPPAPSTLTPPLQTKPVHSASTLPAPEPAADPSVKRTFSPDTCQGLANVNVKNKKAFASALLQGIGTNEHTITEEMTSSRHLHWLFKWVHQGDTLALQSARCLASLAYPDELVVGLQERILEEKALHPILDFVKKGEVEVHREIRWDQLVLGDLIAQGASGKVYKAKWLRRDKMKAMDVVAKVATESNLAFSLEEHLFELGLMSMLNHEHVMRALGGSTKGPNYFLIMPFMAEGSLENQLKTMTSSSTDWLEKLRLALCICKAMCYLHEHNVIHRDLKSANVLLGSNRVVQVTDFGISRVVDDNQMTMNIGTTAWIAPEIFESGTYSLSADVYSFSIVLWEIITAETPYDGASTWSIPGKVMKGERPPIPGQCPQTIKTLLSKCWDNHPSNRPDFNTIKEELYELYKRLRRLAV